MSMAQAIELGRRSNDYAPVKLVDPGQALNAMTGASAALNTRRNPTAGGGVRTLPPLKTSTAPTASQILSSAQAATLLDAELKKKTAEAKRMELENQALAANQVRAAEAHKQTMQTAAVDTRAKEYALSDAQHKQRQEFWKGEDVAKQQRDYDMGMKSLLMGDTQPFVHYMRQYGSPKQNLESIEVSPDGQEFLVKIAGQKKPLLLDRKRFEAMIGAVNPKILESMSAIASRNATAATKAQEITLKEQEVYSRARERLSKEYDSKWKNPVGELKPGAPEFETWAQGQLAREGVKQPGTAPAIETKGKPETAAPAAPQKRDEGPYQDFRNGKGETLRVYNDGRQVILDTKGEKVAERVVQGIDKSKTKKAETPSPTYGTVTYTDPNTGEKVRKTMQDDGSMKRDADTTDGSGKDGDEDNQKTKKKKKKKAD